MELDSSPFKHPDENTPWQAPCLTPAETLSRGPNSARPGLLSYRNYKIINAYYLKPLFFFFSGLTASMACGTLVLPPGIKPASLALEVWLLNHSTTREVSKPLSLDN